MSDVTKEATLAAALATVGRNKWFQDVVLKALRQAEREASDPAGFRWQVRRPLTLALLDGGYHRVVLSNGLIYEVNADSRIEEALLLSVEANPDHVWEPQTTRLLVSLCKGVSHAIVGGAYIGDHVLPMARAMTTDGGTVHAFEPMERAFRRLVRHLEINEITNVVAHRLGLWDRDDVALSLEGPAALASSGVAESNGVDAVASVSIDGYVEASGLTSVGLIMLDTEGGEERALRGARKMLAFPPSHAPHLIFEVHRSYVDWTDGLENTSVFKMLVSHGYETFAIRDFHDNYPMAGMPIEIIPADAVYLEGPPHGFNVLATKDRNLIERLGLRVVRDVSPKLLPDKDPALHHPLDGLPR